MFGKQYGISLEDWMTFSFVQFIPIKRFVKQSELFQLYQDYQGSTATTADSAQLSAHIFVACRRVMSIDKGMIVLQ